MPKTKANNAKKHLMPLLIIIGVTCIMSLIFYPMMNMKVENLPVAVVSLDEGATTAQGEVNAGDQMATKLVESGKKDNATMVWTKLDSKKALNTALDNYDYYAAVVIPKDFTAKQVATKQADMTKTVTLATQIAQAMIQAQTQAQAQGLQGEAVQQAAQAAAQKAVQEAMQTQAAEQQSTEKSATADTASIQAILDNAKSPMVANLLKTALTTALGQTGITVNTKVINAGDTDTNAQPMTVMMGQNTTIMPTFMMSFVASIFTLQAFKRKRYASTGAKWKDLGIQILYIAGISLLVALGVDCVQMLISGNWLASAAVPFLWLCSFAIMSVVVGLGNVAFPLGVAVGGLSLVLGMSSGLFAPEMLPSFWRNWIYPWVPQRYIGDGFRDIAFNGAGAWNAGSTAMLITAIVGICAFVIAGLLPKGRKVSAFED
jgi:YhgE/Pip-like protein